MATLQPNQKIFALLPATVINQSATWIKAEADIVIVGSSGNDGVPKRRITNVKLAFASFAIVDQYGYFLKRPAVEHAGSSGVRLFSEGLEWLNQNSILVSPDALRIALNKFSGEKKAHELSQIMKSNPTYESEAYKNFLHYFLPKGTPLAI